MINIDELIKNARSSNNKIELRAYQNIKAEFEKFKYAQILTRKIDDEIETRLIFNYSKKLEDAIKQFSEARRHDLVDEYTSELEVVKKLLPEPVNSQEIENFIENDEKFFEKFWVTLEDENSENYQNGGEGTYMQLQIPKKEMGNAIKHLKSKFPTADGKMISEIVKKYIV